MGCGFSSVASASHASNDASDDLPVDAASKEGQEDKGAGIDVADDNCQYGRREDGDEDVSYHNGRSFKPRRIFEKFTPTDGTIQMPK